MNKKTVDVQIAELKKDTEHLIEDNKEVKRTLQDLVNEVRSGMRAFETRINSLEKQWLKTKFLSLENQSRIKRVERILLSIAGAVLLAVLAKLLGLIGL